MDGCGGKSFANFGLQDGVVRLQLADLIAQHVQLALDVAAGLRLSGRGLNGRLRRKKLRELWPAGRSCPTATGGFDRAACSIGSGCRCWFAAERARVEWTAAAEWGKAGPSQQRAVSSAR